MSGSQLDIWSAAVRVGHRAPASVLCLQHVVEIFIRPPSHRHICHMYLCCVLLGDVKRPGLQHDCELRAGGGGVSEQKSSFRQYFGQTLLFCPQPCGLQQGDAPDLTHWLNLLWLKRHYQHWGVLKRATMMVNAACWNIYNTWMSYWDFTSH